MAVMLRVGMQGVALRADIPKAKLARQISVPQLVDTPEIHYLLLSAGTFFGEAGR